MRESLFVNFGSAFPGGINDFHYAILSFLCPTIMSISWWSTQLPLSLRLCSFGGNDSEIEFWFPRLRVGTDTRVWFGGVIGMFFVFCLDRLDSFELKPIMWIKLNLRWVIPSSVGISPPYASTSNIYIFILAWDQPLLLFTFSETFICCACCTLRCLQVLHSRQRWRPREMVQDHQPRKILAH